METDRVTNKICRNRINKAFEEPFKEYKRRVFLSRLFLVLSFSLFSLAIVFSLISITFGVVLFILGFYSNLISKKHLSIAALAERFIMCEF
jgi:ABC-type multidrug transport system permease subunit